MAKFIVGNKSDAVYEALYDAGVFADDPKNVRRVVIDLKAGEGARVYIEKFLDSSFVDVIVAGGVEIVVRDVAGDVDDVEIEA